jgi:hypothetical protein
MATRMHHACIIDTQSGPESMTDVKRTRRRASPTGNAPTEPERDILVQYL